MKRPQITKQTLKELRGELFAKQYSQKNVDEMEQTIDESLSNHKTEEESHIQLKDENEMGM